MKILITGAAGFIGSNLAKNLVDNGHDVWGIDNFSYGSFENIRELVRRTNFRFFTHDVRYPFVDYIPGGADVVVHLASHKIPRYYNALRTLDDNSLMMRNMVEYCKKYKSKFVFSSTSDVYGKNNLFREDADLVIGNPCIKRWAYAVSKIYSEHYIHACHDDFGLEFTIMRFFNAYGPNNNMTWWGGPVSIFIQNISDGVAIDVHGDGNQTRCYTYIDDTVAGIVKCIFEDNSLNEVFNIGNPDTEISVFMLAHTIAALLGKEPIINLKPYSDFGNYEDVSRRVPNIEKARTMLGFNPEYNLSEGLLRTINWHKKMGYIK
jgi:UDP-glucose 4-epimerase